MRHLKRSILAEGTQLSFPRIGRQVSLVCMRPLDRKSKIFHDGEKL
jgi:hypothetical protein